MCIFLCNNRHHADAHVKHLIHLSNVDPSILLQDFENARYAPVFRLDYRITIQRKNSRYVIDETAAGDVGETFDRAAGNFCQKRLIVLVHA